MFKTKIYIFLTFFLTNNFLYGQVGIVDSSSQYFTVFTFDSGATSSYGLLINGKPDGYWMTFYENGNLKSEGNRVNFKLDSTWYFYNENQQLIKTIDYKEDLRNGLTVTYDSIYIISEEYFIDNIKQGINYTFYPDSFKIVKSKVNYINGKEDGYAYYFGKDERVISITEYNKGFIVSKQEINRYNRENKKQGIWKDFYPNWKVKTERTYRNDLLNGYLKYYSIDGQLTKAELYVDGVLQKEEENSVNFQIIPTYNKTGNIIKETTYNTLGEKDGVEKIFSDSGNVIKSVIYKNNQRLLEGGIIDTKGRKQLNWKEFYNNQSIKSEGSYLNNKKIDNWIFYYENGQAEQIGKYNKNGQPIGNWVWYYENGDTLRFEQFRRGIEDGSLIEKTDSGNVISKGAYLDGFKEGEWIYELNDHIEKGSYSYGDKTGEWKHFNKNGKLIFKGNYIQDRPDGKHKWWYSNGKLKEEGSYAYGQKNGTWKKYDINGILKISINYKDGKEYKINGKKIKFNKKKK